MDKIFIVLSIFATCALCLMAMSAAGWIGNHTIDKDIAYIEALEKANNSLQCALEKAIAQNGISQNAVLLIVFRCLVFGVIFAAMVFKHKENMEYMRKNDGIGIIDSKAERAGQITYCVSENGDYYELRG